MSTKPTSELDALDQIIKKLSECENLARYLTSRPSKNVGGDVAKAKNNAKTAREKLIKQAQTQG